MMLCCPCNRIVPLSARHACALLAVARSADISDDEVLCELLALNGGWAVSKLWMQRVVMRGKTPCFRPHCPRCRA